MIGDELLWNSCWIVWSSVYCCWLVVRTGVGIVI